MKIMKILQTDEKIINQGDKYIYDGDFFCKSTIDFCGLDKPIVFTGHLKTDGGITSRGGLSISAEKFISSKKDITTNGNLETNGYIYCGGEICVSGSLIASEKIYSEGDIIALEISGQGLANITSKKSIFSKTNIWGYDIHSKGSIEAKISIDAYGSIIANRNIKAGDSIFAQAYIHSLEGDIIAPKLSCHIFDNKHGCQGVKAGRKIEALSIKSEGGIYAKEVTYWRRKNDEDFK